MPINVRFVLHFIVCGGRIVRFELFIDIFKVREAI
jgi:hypothetical protein